MVRAIGIFLTAASLAACSAERRPAGPDQPQTPPNGPADPRATAFETNKYQLGQGGRYFTWYGCGACHGRGATGALDLADDRWLRGGTFDRVYQAIADGHPGITPSFGARIPPHQLWQVTAYVRSLKDLPAAQRRRQDLDAAGEAEGSNWAGPIR
jgi:mono/diheme cytochrome c family protein